MNKVHIGKHAQYVMQCVCGNFLSSQNPSHKKNEGLMKEEEKISSKDMIQIFSCIYCRGKCFSVCRQAGHDQPFCCSRPQISFFFKGHLILRPLSKILKGTTASTKLQKGMAMASVASVKFEPSWCVGITELCTFFVVFYFCIFFLNFFLFIIAFILYLCA